MNGESFLTGEAVNFISLFSLSFLALPQSQAMSIFDCGIGTTVPIFPIFVVRGYYLKDMEQGLRKKASLSSVSHKIGPQNPQEMVSGSGQNHTCLRLTAAWIDLYPTSGSCLVTKV